MADVSKGMGGETFSQIETFLSTPPRIPLLPNQAPGIGLIANFLAHHSHAGFLWHGRLVWGRQRVWLQRRDGQGEEE